MISNYELQQAYNDLYAVLRMYIWEYDVIDAIANLEIAVYETLADVNAVKNAFRKLDTLVRPVSQRDEDVKNAMKEFSDVIDSADSVYCKLTQVNEVIQV